MEKKLSEEKLSEEKLSEEKLSNPSKFFVNSFIKTNNKNN